MCVYICKVSPIISILMQTGRRADVDEVRICWYGFVVLVVVVLVVVFVVLVVVVMMVVVLVVVVVVLVVVVMVVVVLVVVVVATATVLSLRALRDYDEHTMTAHATPCLAIRRGLLSVLLHGQILPATIV